MIKIKRREQDISLASMSDIAFLLIIFFLISISFLYKEGIKLNLPKKYSKPVVLNSRDIAFFKLDFSGRLYQNNRLIDLKGIKADQVKAVIISVDKKCAYKYLVCLLEELHKNNITKMSIKKI